MQLLRPGRKSFHSLGNKLNDPQADAKSYWSIFFRRKEFLSFHQFCKTFEKCIYNSLYSYLESNNMLSKSQSGSLKGVYHSYRQYSWNLLQLPSSWKSTFCHISQMSTSKCLRLSETFTSAKLCPTTDYKITL